MKKPLIAMLVSLVAMTTFSSVASASFMAECTLRTQVVSVDGPTVPHEGTALASRPATLRITKVLHQGGHTDRFCKGWEGRTFTVALRGEGRLDSLKKGDDLRVHFLYVSNATRDGMRVWKTWKLLSER